jgi:hypothetical protein
MSNLGMILVREKVGFFCVSDNDSIRISNVVVISSTLFVIFS